MSVENLAGQTLGQYQLRELLGAGGMGAVYRAYQANLKREVAVKVLPSNLVGEPGYFERFTREAEIAAALEHPHIVPVYDYGTQGKISYVVMRRLTGGSLADRLKQGKQPSLGEIVALLKQLASALDYAHSQDVIHRDIKPNNVMFDNHGSSYLVDFGIAKLLTAATQLTGTGMVIGTPPFIAPELWRGDEASPASDEYALAVMAYLLVTGHPPFEAPTAPGLMYKHLNEMPTPAHTRRTGAPEAITLVLERALAKDPAQRFPTMTAFAQALEGAVQGAEGTPTQFFNAPPRPRREAQPAAAAPLPPASPTGRGSVRPWGWLAFLMAAVVVVILLASRSSPTASPTAPPTALTPTALPTVIAAEASGLPSNTPALAPSATQNAVPSSSETPAPTQTPLPTTGPTDTLQPTLPPTDTPQPTPTPSATIDLLAQVWQSYTQTAQAWTATPTPTLTPPPNLTATYEGFQTAAAATVAAGNQIATQAALASTPVARNADWTPVVQTFDGVEMVLVPAGCFDMGSTHGGSDDERPVNRQCFATPFWIDRYEVTNAQYGSSGQFSGDNRPRDGVTWLQARDFCAGREARLPTEAEWEYAARGPDDLLYPWGNTFVADNVVYYRNSNSQTADVGSRRAGASWVGALDMSGNVWEWTSSAYQSYPYVAGDGREDANRTDVERVVRGGSWNFPLDDSLRAASRFGYDPSVRDNSIGARCTRSY